MGWKMTQQGAPGPGQLRSKSYAGALANLEKLCERMEEMVISWWFDGDLMGFNGKNMEELHGKSWKKWWFRDLTKKNGVLMEFRQQQWWIGFNGDRMRIYRDILWYTQLWTLARTKVFVGWFWEICEFSHHFLGQILTRHILSDGQWWCQTDRSNDIQRSQIQDVLFRSNNIQQYPTLARKPHIFWAFEKTSPSTLKRVWWSLCSYRLHRALWGDQYPGIGIEGQNCKIIYI
jgi:hypothetical protein